ncbi:hypothetical protein FE257_007733 [Aspergillus nanangensis]|uniref:DUF3445 domain-containing protein n=1 Tax=Aspergillus nanangensis TaxID=2582783 RepID=A0AAD4CXE8_ASPNN|nr:hypothetical protein FE257_007733 [Aspergillus nanangensis]
MELNQWIYILLSLLLFVFLYTRHYKSGVPQTPKYHHELGGIKPQPKAWTWDHQEPVPYRPWHNGPYHVTMGLKNANITNWIEVDNTYLPKYRLKKRLFADSDFRPEVLQVLPGCDEEAFEALELLKDVLLRQYPSMFQLVDSHRLENKVTGDVWDLRREAETWKSFHPLEVMSLLATEDFFLLKTDEEGVTTLRAGAVCFPAGWKISQRIGHSLWQIHAGKVPQYESKLAKSMDRFFVKLPVGGSISRFNYAIDDSNELFHIHSHHNLTLDPRGSPLTLADLHLRVERQFLQRLPRTRGLLFSIRTYITPISEVTRDLELARALRTSVGSYTPDVAKYKNKPLWNDLLQQHLNEVLGEEEEGHSS